MSSAEGLGTVLGLSITNREPMSGQVCELVGTSYRGA
jgi:hypothetical protein